MYYSHFSLCLIYNRYVIVGFYMHLSLCVLNVSLKSFHTPNVEPDDALKRKNQKYLSKLYRTILSNLSLDKHVENGYLVFQQAFPRSGLQCRFDLTVPPALKTSCLNLTPEIGRFAAALCEYFNQLNCRYVVYLGILATGITAILIYNFLLPLCQLSTTWEAPPR